MSAISRCQVIVQGQDVTRLPYLGVAALHKLHEPADAPLGSAYPSAVVLTLHHQHFVHLYHVEAAELQPAGVHQPASIPNGHPCAGAVNFAVPAPDR